MVHEDKVSDTFDAENMNEDWFDLFSQILGYTGEEIAK